MACPFSSRAERVERPGRGVRPDHDPVVHRCVACPDSRASLPTTTSPTDLNLNPQCLTLSSGHLSDDELVAFLKRSRAALRQQPTGGPCEGYILLKENVCKDETERLFDEDDSSYTRYVLHFPLDFVRRAQDLTFGRGTDPTRCSARSLSARG